MVIEMNRVHLFVVCSTFVSLVPVLLCLKKKKKNNWAHTLHIIESERETNWAQHQKAVIEAVA